MEGFTAALVFEEAVLRQAVRTFVVRRVLRSWMVIAAGSLLVASLLLWASQPSKPDFALGVTIAGGVGLILYVVVVWRAHLNNALERFRALSPKSGELEATRETLTLRTSLGSSTVAWSRFTEVWVLRDCWLLFWAPSGFINLPIAGFAPAQLAFLRSVLPQPS